MKRIFTLLIAMLPFMHVNALIKVIDISTGTNGNWTVRLPGTSAFVPAVVGLGGWISPGSTAAGNYDYQMTFNLSSSCPVQSAVINLSGIQYDDIISQITLNGHILSGPPYNTLGINPSINVNILTTFVNLNSPNILIITVVNAVVSKTGLQMNNSNLTIETEQLVDYYLTDQDGNKATEFCVGQDIFINGSGQRSLDYSVRLFEVYLGNLSPKLSILYPAGPIAGLNITDLFGNVVYPYNLPPPFVFNPSPSVSYEIELIIQTSCGQDVFFLDFRYNCCGPPDASFSIASNGIMLSGKAATNGQHTWKLYAAPNPNSGPYTPIASDITTQKFLVETPGTCYLVSHTLANGCGTTCMSQRFCNFGNCESKKCDLSAPVDLSYDAATKEFSWSVVPGAMSYILEITVNDPVCCNIPPPYPLPNIPHIISTSTNYHLLDELADLGTVYKGGACFSWRVYALCPDGTKSVATDGGCSAQQRPASNNSITGIPAIDNEKFSVQIFPNPAKGITSIEIKTPNDVELNINIFDRTGKIVKSFEPIKTIEKGLNIKWDTESLSEGVYLVKILTSDNKIITKKLMID